MTSETEQPSCGDRVRIYEEDDWFYEGLAVARTSTNITVDFGEWIEQWPVDALRAVPVECNRTVWVAAQRGVILADYRAARRVLDEALGVIGSGTGTASGQGQPDGTQGGDDAEMADTFDTALELIASVRAALGNGLHHYDANGQLLASEIDIVEALRSGVAVDVVDFDGRPPRVDRDAILAELRASHRRH